MFSFVSSYIFNLFILPIESFLEVFLKDLFAWNQSVILSLFILSLIVSVITNILVNYISTYTSANSKKKEVIDNKIKEFNSVFKGRELYFVTRTLYRQNKYHPLYSIVGSLALMVQVPFFVAAYLLLKDNHILQDASCLFINNLSKPDNILFGLNILPILMFAIGVIGSWLVIKNKSLRLQNILLSSVFLIILYNMPSGLVLYWIFNNIFALINLLLIRKYLSSSVIVSALVGIKRIFPIILLLLIFILIFPLYGNISEIFFFSGKNIVFVYKMLFYCFMLGAVLTGVFFYCSNRLNFFLSILIFFIIFTIFMDRVFNHYTLLLHSLVFIITIACALMVKNSFKIVQNALLVLVISLVFVVNYQYTESCLKGHKCEINVKNPLDKANIKLDGRNVYYVSFDGYLSKAVWNYIYPDVHNGIYDYLKNNGFTLYKRSYSMGRTVATFTHVTSMMKIPWNSEVIVGSGSVYKIFSQNKYKNANYFGYALFNTCGKYVDICMRRNDNSSFFNLYYKNILKSKSTEVVPNDFEQAFATIKKAQNIKGSKHVLVHIQAPNHSPNPPKGWDKKSAYLPNYLKTAVTNSKLANVHIRRFVDYIRKNDPKAIIVLASDHGMHMIRTGSLKLPLTRAQDTYATLLTVRWPEDCVECKDYKIYDMANLYRYIFMTLNTNNKKDFIKKTMVKIDKTHIPAPLKK